MSNAQLDAALEQHEMGRSVIPLKPDSKVAAVSWARFQDQSATEDEIHGWWDANPTWGMGIVTGKVSGIFVMDVDGEEGYAALYEAGIRPPETYTVEASRGKHFYYQYSKGVKTHNGILPKVDIASDGHYVVAPPTVRNGFEYTVEHDVPVAVWDDIPELFMASPKKELKAKKLTKDAKWIVAALTEPIQEGERDKTLFKMARYFLGRSIPEDIVVALLVDAALSCEPPFAEEQLEHAVRSAARYVENDVLETVSIDTVEREQVHYLVPDRIPRSKLTVLGGVQGQGKTFAALSIAATLSVGGELPDGSQAVRTNCLILSAEDAVGDTIKPRLEDMGADLKACRVITEGQLVGGKSFRLNNEDHQQALRRTIEKWDAGFLIIDTLNSFAPGLDPNKEIEVRDVLIPLRRIAEETGCAILGIMHFNKSLDHKGLGKFSGGSAYTAVPRSVLAVTVDPEDANSRYLTSEKLNTSRQPDAWKFTIVCKSDDSPDGIVLWTGVEKGRMEDFHAAFAKRPKEISVAEVLLHAATEEGPRLRSDLVQLAEELDISESALNKARKNLGYITTKVGNSEGSGGIKGSVWSRPDTDENKMAA